MSGRCSLFFGMTALLTLSCVFGCGGLSPSRDVNFYPLLKDSLPSRSQPARVTGDQAGVLREKGYVAIGTIEIKRVVERCQGPLSDPKSKCEKFASEKNTTAELLEEASRRGGELVSVYEDRLSSERQTTGQLCVRWATRRSYSTMVYRYGRYEPGYQTENYCESYEKIQTTERIISSVGMAYIHHPQLAAKQAIMDEFSFAVQDGDRAAVKKALDKGMPAGQRDSFGYPVFYWAAESGNVDMAELLLSRGADATASGPGDITPLHVAADKGRKEMVRFLVSRGVRIDARDSEDNTPLMYAARRGHADVANILLEAGASPNAKNNLGNTPLFIAVIAISPTESGKLPLENMFGQNPEVVRILMKRGADIAKTNNSGITAPAYAIEMSAWGKAARYFTGYCVGAYGFIDRTGKWVVKPEFSSVHAFSEGLAAVAVGHSRESRRWGFIDRQGKLVVPPRFTLVGKFSQGLASVSIDRSSFGYINKKGDWVIEPRFKDAGDFVDGLAPARADSGKMGFINKKGVFVISPQYINAQSFSDGWAKVIDGSSVAYIDKKGKTQLSSAGYPRYTFNDPFSEGLTPFSDSSAKINRKIGYMDKKGNVVIAPRFKEGAPFKNGLARVLEDEMVPRYKFIDKTGRIAIPDSGWTMATSFSENTAMTMSKWGPLSAKLGKREVIYIDTEGKPVLTLDYLTGNAPAGKEADWDYGFSYMKPVFGAGGFSEGLAGVRVLGNKYLEIWDK